jgi:hypothetical protein
MNGNVLPTPKLASPLLDVEVCRNSCTPQRRICVGCVGRTWPRSVWRPKWQHSNFIKSPSEHDRLTSRHKSMQLHPGTAIRARERHHCGIWRSKNKPSSSSSSSWTASPFKMGPVSCAETSVTTQNSEDLNSGIISLECQSTKLRNVGNYLPVKTA